MKNARRYLALLLSLMMLFSCFDAVAEGIADVQSSGSDPVISDPVISEPQTDEGDKASGTLAIITEPEDQTQADGGTVVLTVVATGATSYLWQYSNDGKEWYTGLSTWEGYNTNTMTITLNAGLTKLYYRCAVTGTSGTIYTRTVRLSIGVPTVTPTPAPVGGAV